MSSRPMRKMISYKIENLNDKERALVDEWANAQSNLHQSLTNVIMHIVGVVGNVDVMDFDIQKKLHLTLGNPNISHELEQDIIKGMTSSTPIKNSGRTDKDEFPNVDIFEDE